jgi:hypothetical protein
MKHFSAREFALLCSPLLIIGVVGWLLSKRRISPDEGKLHLAFHVEKPTTLEAFKGSDAALVVGLAGEGADKMRVASSDPWLEVQGAHGAERSYMSRGYSGIWTKVWKSNSNGTRFTINSQVIPAGQLRFGTSSAIQTLSATTFAAPRTGSWLLNRAQIKPFGFKKMTRLPLVHLRSVKIIQINPGNIRGETVFDLTGPTMNAQTPFDYDFSERRSGMGSGYGSSDLTPQTATRRVREWTVFKPFVTASGYTPKIVPVRISGRVSADNRWPLAFQIEPFTLAKIKVGQKLRFKSWPVPVPKSESPISRKIPTQIKRS